jgi:hypothetical protein
MEAEIDTLNEAISALKKARKSIEKAGGWIAALAGDQVELDHLIQKYEAGILQRKRVLMAVAVLTEMGMEIGSPFPFSEKSKAVFELEDTHIVLRMLLKQNYSDKDYDYIIRHVIGIITRSAEVNLPKADCVENSTGEEIKALAAFLAGQKEYEELKSEATNCVDGVLSIV